MAAARIAFSEIVGETAILPSIKYVITLDTDTQLPRESARQLVGTMAHPLNRPQFDPARGIVTEGYSLLQPRVDVSLPEGGSFLVRSAPRRRSGIDPYTRAVSDVYQDLFHEGSFIGKGIYEVDAFERALAGRFPENTILSHDLLESVHARCALVSDVKLYEEYPSRYDLDVNRRHRWIRGDWQIMPWLLPWVPGAEGRRIANPLSALSWWKIFDNLRRSLVPIALLFFLLGIWLLVPGLGGSGACSSSRSSRFQDCYQSLAELMRKPEQLPWLMHLRGVGVSAPRARPDLTHAGVPALRCLHQSDCHRADAVPHDGHAQTASGMAHIERCGAHGAHGSRRLLRHDVDRTIGRSGRRNSPGRDAAGTIAGGPAVPRSLARGALDRVVDQPADRAAGARTDHGAIDLSATHRPQDLAFF